MKFRFAVCLFITAAGVGACNLSPGYDLPSAGDESAGDGDIVIDRGGDGDNDLAPGVGCGGAGAGAGGAGGACADGSETAESN